MLWPQHRTIHLRNGAACYWLLRKRLEDLLDLLPERLADGLARVLEVVRWSIVPQPRQRLDDVLREEVRTHRQPLPELHEAAPCSFKRLDHLVQPVLAQLLVFVEADIDGERCEGREDRNQIHCSSHDELDLEQERLSLKGVRVVVLRRFRDLPRGFIRHFFLLWWVDDVGYADSIVLRGAEQRNSSTSHPNSCKFHDFVCCGTRCYGKHPPSSTNGAHDRSR
mmetsp:Transcript_63101/g.148635  ORF Transcript_63101/g.148635 Transcript_63101/m.148635 type:complete len:223 (+) Transcript_63101:1145-1813(+)